VFISFFSKFSVKFQNQNQNQNVTTITRSSAISERPH